MTEATGAERRTAPRIPLRHEIRIFHSDLRRLATEICRDISVSGMFVEIAAPPEVGAEIGFELHVPTRPPQIVRGEGDVVWRRTEGGDADRPAGYGVRFARIDSGLREIVYRVVDRFIQHGGDPFDLDVEG